MPSLCPSQTPTHATLTHGSRLVGILEFWPCQPGWSPHPPACSPMAAKQKASVRAGTLDNTASNSRHACLQVPAFKFPQPPTVTTESSSSPELLLVRAFYHSSETKLERQDGGEGGDTCRQGTSEAAGHHTALG